MNEQEALQKMISPGMRRNHIWRGGVLQIWITRACDKSCFHCTQASNLKGPYDRMPVEQFEQACKSLDGYFGVIGIFGGNPTLHPQFDEICNILRSHFSKEQCGLWCNKLHGKGEAARATFNPNYSNLNVHLDKDAYAEFVATWPEAATKVFGLTDSRHASPWIAMKDLDRLPTKNGDVENTEENRLKLISECDINQNWSALIGRFRGMLRAWFCEIAGSQAMLKQNTPGYPDTGVEVIPGWWSKSMLEFAPQVRKHCHECGVPLREYGELAVNGSVERISETYKDEYLPKDSNRKVEIVKTVSQLRGQGVKRVTDYVQNASVK